MNEFIPFRFENWKIVRGRSKNKNTGTHVGRSSVRWLNFRGRKRRVVGRRRSLPRVTEQEPPVVELQVSNRGVGREGGGGGRVKLELRKRELSVLS